VKLRSNYYDRIYAQLEHALIATNVEVKNHHISTGRGQRDVQTISTEGDPNPFLFLLFFL
jgi:hypothetical protein